MHESPQLSGVLPVLQTPFNEAECIDFETLVTEIEWALSHGSDGLTIGMVSEVIRLSAREREQLAEVVCEAVGGKAAIVSCGAESSHQAVHLAEHAESVGASALMAIPPLHVALNDAELVDYYAAILDATTIPLVVQDASGYVGRSMSPQVLVRLFDRFGSRILAKPEANPIGPNLSAIREATKGLVPVFEGSGGIALIDSFRRGIKGTMPAVDLCWAVRCIWDALVAGNDDVAYTVSAPLCALITLQTELDAFVAIEKYLLLRQGVFKNAIQRRPVSYKLDSETLTEIDRLFERLQIAVSLATGGPLPDTQPARKRPEPSQVRSSERARFSGSE